ncbi:sulfotransferase family protein [Nocardioides sp.]|uniref:sulfotransferase family protein n=1 Tax=Nocardioides sp. TaxID=35761 RepID=UPI00271882BC|nr:sulfotransferase family protein [Nocardioides sp.]MDO9457929.1 sulfotransferase family protein [Nocardioides sp.]
MEEPVKRRVVFVVGSGRSGTSTMAGALRTLGMHVPQPEVAADATNPKGFGEPQWVVDFHAELLKRCNVQVSDARPAAWFEAGKLAGFEPSRERLHTWLEEQLTTGGPELVVKDPRLAWFVGLWRSAAIRCDATPAYVTMLRPPAEVVGSKQTYYAANGPAAAGEVQRTAAWVNMMLHTERATRGATRKFVRYADLLDDWTIPLFDIGRRFDLTSLQEANANHVRAVHAFIDPGLRRVSHTWDDLEVPAPLRDLAQDTWDQLDLLADPDGDVPAVHDRLDELRSTYAALYADAEAIAHSTALAARREGLATLPAPVNAVVKRGADRVPHTLRAMVPPAARQRLRKAIGRAR